MDEDTIYELTAANVAFGQWTGTPLSEAAQAVGTDGACQLSKTQDVELQAHPALQPASMTPMPCVELSQTAWTASGPPDPKRSLTPAYYDSPQGFVLVAHTVPQIGRAHV